ncbi:hypothetical protein [Asticcacaulis sp. AC402]|uniref:hypothetical protein n=1 Tax=Asticcacaulis sp. AC402 TaxID=1282361 RepID=UPI0003C3D486|nr:hypothetical protein [Asticcacaulis sp. AC402]ESQ76254.1 hypothetical protein ABAC402_05100 [Asticcacaulis sp. AC402]
MAFLASALMALSLLQAAETADIPSPAQPAATEQRGNIFTRWLPGKRNESAEQAPEPSDETAGTEKRSTIFTRWLPGKRNESAEQAPEPSDETAGTEKRGNIFTRWLPGKRNEQAERAQTETPPTEVEVKGLRRWKNMFPDKKQKVLTDYHGDKIKTQKWSSGQWIIEVRRDGFADGTQCYLRTREMVGKSRITYADGVLGFRFKHYVDPNKVFFRVDDRPSKAWRAVFRDLHMLGLTVKPYASDYRDESVILIPAEEMAGAHEIAIRPTEEGKPEKFDIKGFEKAMAASKRVGCVEYVREDF